MNDLPFIKLGYKKRGEWTEGYFAPDHRTKNIGGLIGKSVALLMLCTTGYGIGIILGEMGFKLGAWLNG